MVLSDAASTTIALTVVEPTSNPTKYCCIAISLNGCLRQQWNHGSADVRRSGYLFFGYQGAGPAVVRPVLLHQLAHMPGKLSSRSGETVPVREFVERLLELRMLIHIGPQFFEGSAGFRQHTLEFRPSLGFGLGKRHLHAAVGVDFAFAGRLD